LLITRYPVELFSPDFNYSTFELMGKGSNGGQLSVVGCRKKVLSAELKVKSSWLLAISRQQKF